MVEKLHKKRSTAVCPKLIQSGVHISFANLLSSETSLTLSPFNLQFPSLHHGLMPLHFLKGAGGL